MLKPLRRKAVIKVTMWLLIATFVIWGFGSVAVTSRNYMGIIFGKKISPQDYSRSYNATVNRAKMIYGDQLSKIQKFLNLEGQAWDRLIILYYAKGKRIKATNNEVVAKIASIPSFQSGGAFDQRAYLYIVQNIFGITPREFEESVRDDIAISRVIDSVEKDAAVTEKETEDAYKIKTEKVDISYIIVKSDSFKNDVAPQDMELKPFYDSNKELFRAQEKVNVYYAKIPFSSEGEKAGEEKEKAKLLAYEVNDYLNAGEDFTAVSKKYNLTVQETGSFSFTMPIPGIGLSYAFSIAAFGLLPKENPCDVAEEKDAFYVIKLKEKIAPSVPPFEEVKMSVRSALISHKAEALSKGQAENYLNILKSGKDTLENLAKQANANISSIKDITRGSYIDGVGLNAEFNKACFTVKENEFAGPVKIQNGYCIIRLDKLKPPDAALFEKEKEQFKNTLLEEKKKKAFQDWLTKLKEKASLKLNR